jgi:hypothetical protein
MKSWYYADHGQLYGPFQDNDLRELIKGSLLTPDTLVWNDGPGNAERGWVRAAESELSALFNEYEPGQRQFDREEKPRVSQTPPSSANQSNFNEYEPEQRRFDWVFRHKICSGKQSIALVFAVIGIAAWMLSSVASYENNGAGNTSASRENAAQSTPVVPKPAGTLPDAKPAKPSGSTPAQSVDSTYQAIFDQYSKKIRAATPKLINEYKAEAAKNSGGLMGLAQISMAKVSKLAEISTEGISEMAKIMMGTGMGKYEVYEAWSGKLMDVYTEEAEKITDAYMASASF